MPRSAADWSPIQAKADQLARQALQQQGSLKILIEQIRGKAERLASTPSIWPAHGWLTSRFGYRISPFTGLHDFHAGIDIAAEPGTTIVAPARGRVVSAGPMGPLGNVVVLEHGHGLRTTFGHAREVLVREGQTVERGERIASVGSSGRSTGPHLHYAVERDGRLTNPIDYIIE
jgi:murein DD-endopeptidase MepM/ murein hydrolase activator NlpD